MPRPLSYRVEGMDCAEEVVALRAAVGPVVGGEGRLSFDLLNGKMTVTDTDAPSEAIVAAVQRAGLQAKPWREERETPHEGFSERYGRIAFTIASGLFCAAGVGVQAWLAGGVASLGAEGGNATAPVPIAARILYGLAIACGSRY